MNNFNIEYEGALDFQHCDDIHDAREKVSKLTNLLNKIIAVRQSTKKEILEKCSAYKGEKMYKLSWENKMVRLSELDESSDLMNLWQDADEAYKRVKLKQDQIMEDLLALKKMIEITMR